MANFQSLLRDAEIIGLHQRAQRIARNQSAIKKSPAVKKLKFRDFNTRIGNPISRILDKRVPLTPYQVEYHETINNKHSILLNKTRKGGFTDAFLRHTAYEIFDHYAGHEIIFMAGNAAPIALDLLDRFDKLLSDNNGFTDYNDKHWSYGDLVMDFHRSTPMEMRFYNGSKIITLPASKSGKAVNVRGYSDVVCWYVTEAAHTGLTDDKPVLNGLTSLTANREDGHQILETTPNGRRGFFYDMWNHATNNFKGYGKVGPNGYYTLQYNYKIAVKYNVIPPKFIEKQKLDPTIDFAQEYECEFTTSSNAAIGPVPQSAYADNQNTITLADLDNLPEAFNQM